MAQFEYQPGSNGLRSRNSYESAARKFVALVISENDETFLMNRGKVRKLHRFNKMLRSSVAAPPVDSYLGSSKTVRHKL